MYENRTVTATITRLSNRRDPLAGGQPGTRGRRRRPLGRLEVTAAGSPTEGSFSTSTA